VDVCHAVLVYCALSEFRILEERWLVRNSDGLCWSTLNRFQYRGWKASNIIGSRDRQPCRGVRRTSRLMAATRHPMFMPWNARM
jgi:hypothetical protein